MHPALALVPILPFMPHAKRDFGIYDEREDHLTDTMNRFEHAFKVPVQLVLLLFGLVNAGVPFGSVGSGTWAVFVGLLLGKPIGILLMTFIGVKMGLRAPGGLTYSHTLVVGVAAGIGFTVALFFAGAAFPPGAILDEVKMGALFSFFAAPLAIALGRAFGLRPGDHPPAEAIQLLVFSRLPASPSTWWERGFPAAGDDVVVAVPARAFVEATLRDCQSAGRPGHSQRTSSAIGPSGSPPAAATGVPDKQFSSGDVFDHAP